MEHISKMIFILHLIYSTISLSKPDMYKLKQVQVLFRHGDRTPSKPEFFGTDPNGKVYEIYGYGSVTPIGKERCYKIGQLLRKRYDEFLGEYKNGDVYAYGLSTSRMKVSMDFVLTGLFSKTAFTSYGTSSKPQLIPTHDEDWNKGFLSASFGCEKWRKQYFALEQDPKFMSIMKNYEAFSSHLKNDYNITLKSPIHAWYMYNNLRAALSLDLPFPGKFTMQDFREIEKLTAYAHKALTYNEQFKRIMAGPLVERFLNVFNDKKSQEKLYIYSSGEFNLAALIDAHNITGAPPIQDYGTTLILEKLRGPDDRVYIRMYLWTGASEQFISLKLDNCERTCLLSDYEKIVQPILPNEETRKLCPYSSSIIGKHTGLPFLANLTMEDYREIEKLTAFAHKSLSRNELFRRLMAGPMIERFLRIFNENESTKKIYLYSACETNLAEFIDAHNITGAPLIQDYGSTLILEKLRGSDERIYMHMYLWTGVSEQLIFLKLEHCEKTRLLSDYEKIVLPVLPNEATRTLCPYSSTIV